jgi:5-methylthioadenosine/S-adenosylhomocysteine deaminase
MPNSSCELIIDARWALPIAPDNRVLDRASLAISDGTILAVGPSPEVHSRFSARDNLTLDHHVLMPGLVNAHGHAAMSLLRGFAEDAPLHEWLQDHIWPLEARLVSEGFVRDGSRLAMAEMIRAGITCFSDMYFYPEVVAREAKALGMRCQVAFPVISFANAWSASSEEAIHKGLSLHDDYRGDPLISVAFGPHSAYSVSRQDLEKILMYSEELDANVQIHLHETAAEVADARASLNSTWIRQLHGIGLLSPRLQAVHMTQVDDAEIVLLAEAGVHVVHCPHSNLKLASGICPTDRLLTAGINIALGTDGAASNNSLDLLSEARLASLLAKIANDDARSLPESRALEMATLGGARALGREQAIGSLEPGKLADVVAVDLSAARFQPVYNPMAQLVHTGAGSAVSHVWIGGRPILSQGAFTNFDEVAMLRDVGGWHAQICL